MNFGSQPIMSSKIFVPVAFGQPRLDVTIKATRWAFQELRFSKTQCSLSPFCASPTTERSDATFEFLFPHPVGNSCQRAPFLVHFAANDQDIFRLFGPYSEHKKQPRRYKNLPATSAGLPSTSGCLQPPNISYNSTIRIDCRSASLPENRHAMTAEHTIGAFPQTPLPRRRTPAMAAPPDPPANGTPALPIAPRQRPDTAAAPREGAAPLIPLRILDAPTQRFYACAFYFALGAWKLYDWLQLVEEDTESFWLFLKWIAIDFSFLFGLPELRIPWLELSQPFVVALFFIHAIFDWMFMFNVGVSSIQFMIFHCYMVQRTFTDLLIAALASMAPWTGQSLLRPRTRYLRAQRQTIKHIA